MSAFKITSEEEGKIKQGTIAEYMRKRTQLVGFEFGYWKHVQYSSEFLDNALDAIESFQWKQLKKKRFQNQIFFGSRIIFRKILHS